MRSIVGADKIAVAMQDCRIAVNHKRRQMAEKVNLRMSALERNRCNNFGAREGQ